VAQRLVSETQQNMQAAENEAIRDCVFVASVIMVENFEMGSYRGLVTGAQQMGQNQIMNLLSENMRQEEQTAQLAEQSAPELFQKAG
jgi:ferritin-like metal-binding protein YciE